MHFNEVLDIFKIFNLCITGGGIRTAEMENNDLMSCQNATFLGTLYLGIVVSKFEHLSKVHIAGYVYFSSMTRHTSLFCAMSPPHGKICIPPLFL